MTLRSKFMIENCISCRQLQQDASERETHHINFNYKALLFPFIETWVMPLTSSCFW